MELKNLNKHYLGSQCVSFAFDPKDQESIKKTNEAVLQALKNNGGYLIEESDAYISKIDESRASLEDGSYILDINMRGIGSFDINLMSYILCETVNHVISQNFLYNLGSL